MDMFPKTNFNDICEPCSRQHRELCLNFFKHGSPQTFVLPGGRNTPLTTKTIVATINVNPPCFCDSCIKLEFESNIIVPDTATSADLTFQIFKFCNNQPNEMSLGFQWNYLKQIASSDSFAFSFYDCNTCLSECCSYNVQVTAIISSTSAETDTAVTIKNAMLTAISINNTKQCI